MSATIGMGMWRALNSIVTGAIFFALLYVAGVLAWKRDPAMLAIIKASQSCRPRYDPGKPGAALVEIVE